MERCCDRIKKEANDASNLSDTELNQYITSHKIKIDVANKIWQIVNKVYMGTKSEDIVLRKYLSQKVGKIVRSRRNRRRSGNKRSRIQY